MATLTSDKAKAAKLLASLNLSTAFDTIQKVGNLGTVHIVCDKPDVSIVQSAYDRLVALKAIRLANQFAAYIAARTGVYFAAKTGTFTLKDGKVYAETTLMDWASVTWNEYARPAKSGKANVCNYVRDARRMAEKLSAPGTVFASATEAEYAKRFALDLAALVARYDMQIKQAKSTDSQPANVVQLVAQAS